MVTVRRDHLQLNMNDSYPKDLTTKLFVFLPAMLHIETLKEREVKFFKPIVVRNLYWHRTFTYDPVIREEICYSTYVVRKWPGTISLKYNSLLDLAVKLVVVENKHGTLLNGPGYSLVCHYHYYPYYNSPLKWRIEIIIIHPFISSNGYQTEVTGWTWSVMEW